MKSQAFFTIVILFAFSFLAACGSPMPVQTQVAPNAVVPSVAPTIVLPNPTSEPTAIAIQSTEAEQPSLKIGLLGTMLDADADTTAYTTSLREGVEMAMQEWNAKGGLLGRQIELLVENDQCDPGAAEAAAKKLISEQGVKFLIGEVCDWAALPVTELANKQGVIQFVLADHDPALTIGQDGKVKQNIFHAVYMDTVHGQAMAKFAYEHGYKTAFVISDPNNAYNAAPAEAFVDAFQKLGGKIVGQESYSLDQPDFPSILAKVKNSAAEVLFMPDWGPNILQAKEQMKQMGVTATFMCTAGCGPAEADLATMEGAYYINHFYADDPNPVFQDWVQKYGAANNDANGKPKAPDFYSTVGYYVATMLFNAIQAAGSDDTAKIKDLIAQGSFDTVFGKIAFDPNHNALMDVTVMGVKDGKEVFIESIAP